jgi:hypothetical protein
MGVVFEGPVTRAEAGADTGRAAATVVVKEAIVPAACAVVIAWFSLGLRVRDLKLPFRYSGDALFYLAQTRMLGSATSYLTTMHLGWPAGFQTYDYPQGGDHLHLGALWLLMRVTHDPMLSVNLYYLAGFALAAFVAHLVLRRLGIRPVLAGALAIVFAIAPYHFSRGETHLFLSAYYLVPFGVWLALTLLEAADEDGASARLRSPWVLLGMVALASAGAYYFAFTVLLVVAAGVGAALSQGRLSVVRPALKLSMLGVAAFAANHATTGWYWLTHGVNSTALPQRTSAVTEVCGLRVAQLFMPQPDHHISALAAITTSAMRGWPPDETGQQIGFVAAGGLLLLIGAVAMAAVGRTRFHQVAGRSVAGRLGRVGYLAAVCIVTGSIGGFSYLLSAGSFGLIRCWNRIAIVIAFLGLLAVGLVAERVLSRAHPSPTERSRRVAWLVAGGLVLVALVDQTPAHAVDTATIGREVSSDRAFFAAVAAHLPKGAKVFELPDIPFPEGVARGGTGSYDPVKGYLYQPGLYWSFGAMRGRPDGGISRLAAMAPAELPVALAGAGYQGLVIDTKALGPQSPPVETSVAALLGDPIRSPDGRYLFHRLAAVSATPMMLMAAAGVAIDSPPPASCP